MQYNRNKYKWIYMHMIGYLTKWGKISYYNFKHCNYALYTYNDDKYTVYLSNVFVDYNYRKNGLGNFILKHAFKKAEYLKAQHICLKCINLSWIHNWYCNNGFTDLCNDTDYKYVWMIKQL